MFYYIYRIGETLKNKLQNSSIAILNSNDVNLTFKKENRYELSGFIDLRKDPSVNSRIDFEIDLQYCFLFIETNHPTILDKSLQILEQFFNENVGGKLENFSPRISKEHELICDSKDFDLKFIHDGEVVDEDSIENLGRKYCDGELDKDYILLEADVKLVDGSSFYYMRKALKIDDKYSKNSVLHRFKKVMA